ncbi:MAG TPA: hypothetical protein VLK33_00070 [Terriglobales bacterium]|nr:hypothetical protein [Terriglobales bacterium]
MPKPGKSATVQGRINRLLALKSPPYPASWLDRLNGWVERLPVSGFVAYLLIFIAIVLVDQLGWTILGYRTFGENLQQTFLYQLFTLEAFYYNYLAYGYSLDALANFRGLLNVPESGFVKLEYEFAILPAAWINTLTVIAIISSVALSFISPGLFGLIQEITPGFIFVQTLGWVFGLLAATILVYRLVHQMRKVSEIYKLVKKVDLYNLGPIYTLSSFMGKASLILLFILYSNLVTDPSNLQISGFLQGSLAISVVALAGFVLPLTGINRRLVDAKTELLRESGSQVRAAFDRLNKEQSSKNLANIGNTRQLVDAVIRKREYIQSIPTWPWQSGTFRNLVLGVLLPIIIWSIQQVLLRTVVR